MHYFNKGSKVILLLLINFFSFGVLANQFTEECGRIIDINDYKRCTRKQFTIVDNLDLQDDSKVAIRRQEKPMKSLED